MGELIGATNDFATLVGYLCRLNAIHRKTAQRLAVMAPAVQVPVAAIVNEL